MLALYVTDIHGDMNKYEKIFQIAIEYNVEMIINGGDMLPTQTNFFKQGEFIENYLDSYFNEFNKKHIYYLTQLGNDDLRIFDELFEAICDKYPYIFSIAQAKVELAGFEFIGMNYVPDLPFGLKDRARKDTPNFTFPRQIGKAYFSTPEGLERIEDWFSQASSLPTIEQEMKNLIEPRDYRKSIYIIHTPPSNLDLDVCYDRSKAGSEAIFNFLKQRQPLLALHGHIHESHDVSNIWMASLDNTICIQPGQTRYGNEQVIYVLLDLNKMSFERLIY